MAPAPGSPDPIVISYLTLRKAVGIIGCALAPVLAFGKWFLQSPGLQPSISAYYYTIMKGVFVGSLFAIGVFLMSYNGYDKKDRTAGILACGFAIGVALLPTKPDCATRLESAIGIAHWTLAALLFLTLAYFSFFLFTKTNPAADPTPQKLKRNVVYRVCGTIIVLCIFAIGIVQKTPIGERIKCVDPVFWLEALAVVSFGFSWLTKGETILKDQ